MNDINKNVYCRKIIMVLTVSFFVMSFLIGCSDSLNGKRFYYINSEGKLEPEMYMDFTKEKCWLYRDGELYDCADYDIMDANSIALNSFSNSAIMKYNKANSTISGSYGEFEKVEVPHTRTNSVVDSKEKKGEKDKRIQKKTNQYPDYCEPINGVEYDGEMVWNKFKNKQTGYVFGFEDYTSNSLYAGGQGKLKLLIDKLGALSYYTDAEVVFFEEDEMGYTLDVLSGQYLLNNDREDESDTPFLCLFELIHTDGKIDYSLYGNNKIYSVIGADSMRLLFDNNLGSAKVLSVDFATLFTDFFKYSPKLKKITMCNELTIDLLCDLAYVHYSRRYDTYDFTTSYTMLSDNVVRIYLEDYERFYWYDVDINTGIGENCAKEYVDLKSVRELFSTANGKGR